MKNYFQPTITRLLSDSKFTLSSAFFWTLFITFLSLISGDNFTDISVVNIPYKDKIVHFIFYFVFAGLWFVFFLNHFKTEKYKIVFLLSVSYGALMELCQEWFTIARTADWLDILANTTGTLVSLWTIYYLKNVKKNKFLRN